MLAIYTLAQNGSQNLSAENSFAKLRFAWGASIDGESPRFRLSTNSQYILIECLFSKRAQFDATLKPGIFHEGLWQLDVLELFLVDQGGIGYQEINLSPAGAWWSCKFSSYRKRAQPAQKAPSAQVSRELRSGDILVALKLKRSELLVQCNFERQAYANVSAMHHGQAFSWAAIPSEKPDFHLVQHFERVRIVASA